MNIQDLIPRTIEAIKKQRSQFDSDAQQARSLGIQPAQLSRIMKGDINKVISRQKWITIARKLDVNLNPQAEWHVAKTQTFEFIMSQLKACQEGSISGVLCDMADIGKTFTAKYYARNNANAVYIDCSQYKSKQKLIRKMAQEFGVGSTGRYNDVYEDLVFYLRSQINPLIILDEAGDLQYNAFLELKALWNATEYACGWYMLGADGLKVKIDRNINHKKVGYTEIFSRFGNRYQRVTPHGSESIKDWKLRQTALIAKANSGGVDAKKLFARTQGSLRRIYIELTKQRRAV